MRKLSPPILLPSAPRIAEANEFLFPSGFGNTKFYLPEMKRVPRDDHSVASVVSRVICIKHALVAMPHSLLPL